MNPLATWQRIRGKSVRYIASRGFTELRRYVRAPLQRRTLGRLSTDDVLRTISAPSAEEIVHDWGVNGPFPVNRERARLVAWYRDHPTERAALDERATRALAREVDLLGRGSFLLGDEIRWCSDYQNAYDWPLSPSDRLDYALLHLPCDVKLPWELSRFQHLFVLGQAWIVNRDARAAEEFRAQVESWDDANPVGLGPNWACTMDVALRSWSLLWLAAAFADAPGLDESFWGRFVRMLWQHGQWMPEHLEKGEINGNHYISDALGLVACGAFFHSTPHGRQWLKEGAAILESEIVLQLEPDGVDIEASVPYQRLVMEIFLAGRQMMLHAGHAPVRAYDERLRAAARYVSAYVTPEGLIPVQGDADDGRVMKFGAQDVRDHRYLVNLCAAQVGALRLQPTLPPGEEEVWFLSAAELDAMASAGTFEPEHCAFFPAGGAAVLTSDTQYAFVDVGNVGLKGLGGHGHNDVLSVEWHAFGRPVLTDSGSFVYTASAEWRQRFRSTEFHTTIMVDGEEINRPYGPLSLWNLHNDARVFASTAGSSGGTATVQASHHGYHRLADPVTTTRRVEMHLDECRMSLSDLIEAKGEHEVTWFFQVAEGLAGRVDGDSLRLSSADGALQAEIAGAGVRGSWTKYAGWFSPSYGVRRPRERWAYSARTKGDARQQWTLAARAAAHIG
ncbi:MAG: alginate lyase family protein [Gemmatimonadota bacterium]